MSITRDTPLGTLTVVPDPVDGGDVVDAPDADVISLEQRRPARSPIIAAGYAWLAADNRSWDAGTAAARACTGDSHDRLAAMHDALRATQGAPLAHFLDAAKPARHLRVAPDTTGGAA